MMSINGGSENQGTNSLSPHEPLYIVSRCLQKLSGSTSIDIAVVTDLEQHYNKVSIQGGKEQLANKVGLDIET